MFHDPEYAKTVQDARSAGGQRRKREVTLAVAYDLQGLSTVPDIRRLVDVAAFDALGLENSIAGASPRLPGPGRSLAPGEG